jgi:hypothetical protein
MEWFVLSCPASPEALITFPMCVGNERALSYSFYLVPCRLLAIMCGTPSLRRDGVPGFWRQIKYGHPTER